MWFADIDPDRTEGFQWQPVIAENESGIVLSSLQTWFATEQDCEKFIEEQLIPNASTIEKELRQ